MGVYAPGCIVGAHSQLDLNFIGDRKAIEGQSHEATKKLIHIARGTLLINNT